MSEIMALDAIVVGCFSGVIGALITGTMLSKIHEKNREHEENKSKWETRKDVVIKLLDSSNKFISASSLFFGSIDGLTNMAEQNKEPNEDYKRKVFERLNDYVESVYQIEEIVGLLILLDYFDSDARIYLQEIQDITDEIRGKVLGTVNKIYPLSRTSINDYREQLHSLRYKYYCSLKCIVDIKKLEDTR